MKLRDFLTLKSGSGILLSGNVYNPYINYSWSQTLTVGGNQQIKDTGTAGLNLQQFFGQGVWFNGIDMSISIGSVPVSGNTTLVYSFVPTPNSRILGRTTWDSFVGFSTVSATEGVVRCRFTGTDTVFTSRLTLGVPYTITLVLKPDVIDLWVNGILRESVSHTYTFAHPLEFIGRNSTAFANCVIKDIYVYNKHLTQAEIEKYNNQPNQFFVDSLEDSSCILAMPMCEKNNLVRNYKNNTDYPITNYLKTCRTNAQRLSYGLQTSGFKRDTNGLILSKSNFLEADGVGYGNTGWVPKWNEDFTVESVFEVSNDSEFRLNGNNYADGIYFGKNSVGKSLYVRVFGSTVIPITNKKDIVCLIFSYNWQTKEVKQYVNGVLVATQLATKTTNAIDPVLLGLTALGGGNYPVIKPLRLFKTHSKVLTQEEVSKNFNKYQAQGLLNE